MLSIIYAPHAIFKQKVKPVEVIDDVVRTTATNMLQLMYAEGAIGIAANMVGIDQQIVVLDLRENDQNHPYVMINPEIIEFSSITDEAEEGSISFPGISAIIKRPSEVTVKYLDLDNNEQVLKAEALLARVIQHEVDYLHGKVFLDHLSKLKRDMLMKKMTKYMKHHVPHVHGEHCNH